MGRNSPSKEREFKLIGFPDQLYLHLRDTADAEEVTNRCYFRLAVEEHLDDVLKLAAQAGFAPLEGDRKLVRTALDPAIKDQLDSAAEAAGLDATTLLLLCLRRKLGLTLAAKERDSILARIKRRLTRSKAK
jgi:hypothetical protein